MKILKAFPPWYNRCIKQVPHYLQHIKNKTTPFPRTLLKIATSTEDVKSNWGGSWKIDSTGEITILFEKKMWDGLLKNKMEWEIVHTLQHEYMEAKLAVKAARSQYPNINPYIAAEQIHELGGQAHFDTIKMLDGISVSSYDTWLERIDSYIK